MEEPVEHRGDGSRVAEELAPVPVIERQDRFHIT